MGSSAKRKKEKKQDFQKPKLKVGKTKPKASNLTDTSFRAKSIVLNQQSLSTTAPSLAGQFTQQLSLVSSKSDSQRRDALSYLTSTPVAVILPKVQPLILDGNKSVRENLLKLLRALPEMEIAGHVDQLLLYVRAGLTHLAVEIRSSSLDVLDWLLQSAGRELVASAGGWVKTLMAFMSLLGWSRKEKEGADKWTASRTSFGKPGSAESKLLVKQLNTLALFLQTGLSSPVEDGGVRDGRLFPMWHTEQHLIPGRSNPYGYLNLFGAPRDVESEMYEDAEGRKEVFGELMYEATTKGVQTCKKEGGEVGRAASAVEKVLKHDMADYEARDSP
ncbi:rRNA processing protein [Taxawa tesnikishii (nom. ined.)]|nr:rRNA processing protein [Dothideales sp. JES 119]